MTTQNVQILDDEEYSVPLDITDIISICKEYSQLGWQIQSQVENILELGVEQSITNGYVKRESLPHIKAFLKAIVRNPYFGDSREQSIELIEEINSIIEKDKSHPVQYN